MGLDEAPENVSFLYLCAVDSSDFDAFENVLPGK